MKDKYHGLVVGVLLGIFIGAIWSVSVSEPNVVLVERGIKQYNQSTGQLEWVESK